MFDMLSFFFFFFRYNKYNEHLLQFKYSNAYSITYILFSNDWNKEFLTMGIFFVLLCQCDCNYRAIELTSIPSRRYTNSQKYTHTYVVIFVKDEVTSERSKPFNVFLRILRYSRNNNLVFFSSSFFNVTSTS